MKYGMLFDLQRCVGCNACAIACSRTNKVATGHFRTHVDTVEGGTYPNISLDLVPHICMHCDEPACLAACPTGATYKNEDGIVLVDNSRCIGCQYCVIACPYDARYIDIKEPGYFPESKDEKSEYEQNMLADHGQGYIDKCVFCHDRLEQGLQPACVETCGAHARVFGDLEDPDSEISRLIATRHAATILAQAGQRPNVYYVK